MKQFSLPRKYTTAAQIWLSVALIILAAIMAFTPILSIDLSESSARKDLTELLDDFNDEVGYDGKIEIPKKVGVSMPKLLTSVGVFTKVVGVISDTTKDMVAGNNADTNKAEEELNDILKSEEGQETISMIMALLMGTVDVDFSDKPADSEESESAAGTVVNTIISVVILIYLLVFVFIWPIVLIITAIITLLKALKAMKEGENVAPKFGAGLLGALGFAVTLAMLLTFVPNVGLGAGMIAILVFCIISLVVNVAVSRLRLYNELDFKYVNLVQGTGLVKLVGFMVFFTSVLKTGFLRGFIDSMSAYLVKALDQVDIINANIRLANRLGSTKTEELVMDMGYLLALALLVVAAILALSLCVSLAKCVAAQLGLVAKKKVAKPGSLANGIIAFVVCIIPVIVSKLENKVFYKFEDGKVVETIEGPLFEMTSDGESALVGMFIGAVLILAADVAFIVTKKMFCQGITKEEENLVLSGNAAIVEETAANTAAPAEEAPAEEAPAEEVNSDN